MFTKLNFLPLCFSSGAQMCPGFLSSSWGRRFWSDLPSSSPHWFNRFGSFPESNQTQYRPLLCNGSQQWNWSCATLSRNWCVHINIFFIYTWCYICWLLTTAGAICRKSNVFFHTDAAQAVGKIPLDVNAMNIDLMSISGHKLYGPKGLWRTTFLSSCRYSTGSKEKFFILISFFNDHAIFV